MNHSPQKQKSQTFVATEDKILGGDEGLALRSYMSALLAERMPWGGISMSDSARPLACVRLSYSPYVHRPYLKDAPRSQSHIKRKDKRCIFQGRGFSVA
jgi:hypothetical protein